MASLKPELITSLGGFPVTNTLVATVIIDIFLIALIIIIYKSIRLRPRGIQSFVEPIIKYLYETTEQIAGKKTSAFFPWFASFFLFILFANLIGLLPGFGTIGFWREVEHHGEHSTELVPLLRAATSDFNLTLALGTISVVATHVFAIKFNGFGGYVRKFISPNPVNLFIGILEFCLEAVKVFSLSFRLFGNIFAGEVVLATVAGLFAFLAPIPFLMLESIVALVQALVFAMLTMVFMTILSTTNEEGGGH